MTTSPAASIAFDFSGRCAVVTGAAGTLGSEAVTQLAAAGARVLAVDYNADAVRDVADRLTQQGFAVTPFQADVRDPDDVRAYAAAGADLGGGSIDMFFNNAGVEGALATIGSIVIDDFRNVFDVNVTGVLLGLQEVLPRMRSGAAVVNTASTAALQASPGASAYIASKHAVLGLTRTAAVESAERGIRVNAICPGPIEGRMMRSLDGQRQRVFSLSDDPRTGRRYSAPEDVARVVLFLLSDAAVLINGQPLRVEVGA